MTRLVIVVSLIAFRQLALFRAARKTGADTANDLDTLPATIADAGFDRKVVYDAHKIRSEMVTTPPFCRKTAETFEGLLPNRVDPLRFEALKLL